MLLLNSKTPEPENLPIPIWAAPALERMPEWLVSDDISSLGPRVDRYKYRSQRFLNIPDDVHDRYDLRRPVSGELFCYLYAGTRQAETVHVRLA